MSVEKIHRDCQHCGDEIITTENRNQKYCSKKCYLDSIAALTVKACKNPVCDNEFECYDQEGKGEFCSSDCMYDYRTIESREVVSCEVCGKEFHILRNNKDDRRFCSNECRHEWIRKGRVLDYFGENNPNWRGGTTYYYGHNWIEMREVTLSRDDHSCVICGRSLTELDSSLEVHHIIPVRIFSQASNANHLENLVTVCRDHHILIEGWFTIPHSIYQNYIGGSDEDGGAEREFEELELAIIDGE
ncbi:HNH endonuclease [Haloterrigena sp. SYSU A121-1]|uniref:HNH endonuclease n=1 Tax=Haloterrigena gelatinilytica TaxID=2741724 RepID=A0A8J8KED6_9EURY|nr:HNH endonuclease signature motif containing protein [Haloterrigena gelatinilytica]NUB91108.1 HNH endonuclease [Haloterrigena gelatinilytica]